MSHETLVYSYFVYALDIRNKILFILYFSELYIYCYLITVTYLYYQFGFKEINF